MHRDSNKEVLMIKKVLQYSSFLQIGDQELHDYLLHLMKYIII